MLSYDFEDRTIFSSWEEKSMKGKVKYTIETLHGKPSLRAVSKQASSGLYHPIKFRLNKRHRLSWEWDVVKFPQKHGPRSKENDDYAARIYVIFTSFSLFGKCIEYIWDESIPEETIFASPYSDKIRFIVAQTGAGGKGWVLEERNIYEDYVKAFGEKPKRKVRALALMTDSDNTQTEAEAYYRRIELKEIP